jgi:hypothetical protein
MHANTACTHARVSACARHHSRQFFVSCTHAGMHARATEDAPVCKSCKCIVCKSCKCMRKPRHLQVHRHATPPNSLAQTHPRAESILRICRLRPSRSTNLSVSPLRSPLPPGFAPARAPRIPEPRAPGADGRRFWSSSPALVPVPLSPSFLPVPPSFSTWHGLVRAVSSSCCHVPYCQHPHVHMCVTPLSYASMPTTQERER